MHPFLGPPVWLHSDDGHQVIFMINFTKTKVNGRDKVFVKTILAKFYKKQVNIKKSEFNLWIFILLNSM